MVADRFYRQKGDDLPLQVYHWNSVTALARYANGNLVVLGRTAREARASALEAGESWWKRTYDYHLNADGGFLDEDAEQEYNRWIAKLADDLEAEPTVESVVFLQGSE